MGDGEDQDMQDSERVAGTGTAVSAASTPEDGVAEMPAVEERSADSHEEANATSNSKPYELESVKTFFSYGLEAAKWHRDRGEGHERRAATLLGFTGATLALLGNLSTPLAKVQNSQVRGVAIGFAALAVGFFIASGIFSTRALGIMHYKATPPAWIIGELEGYIRQPQDSAEDIIATFARSYIGYSEETSMLKSLADNATSRGERCQVAGRLLLFAVLFTSVVVMILLVNGALNPVSAAS